MFPSTEECLDRITEGSVLLQTTAGAQPVPPPWWGELVLRSAHLKQRGSLAQRSERIVWSGGA